MTSASPLRNTPLFRFLFLTGFPATAIILGGVMVFVLAQCSVFKTCRLLVFSYSLPFPVIIPMFFSLY
ncbi:hypothetical protein BJ508DRAFT_146803 [Ascobolus immersus RN42]|uniref:Uncharacterized protein n=1 Tax=Ascobolus immersus RN42 TaxID=1160509 RepID=A0A3N4IPJ6_ASCIM|nr:hypothetical protein BJ508DRAFT_146803 [Ascobolus immersus RN42]